MLQHKKLATSEVTCFLLGQVKGQTNKKQNKYVLQILVGELSK